MKKIPAIVYYLAIAALLGGYIFFFERGPAKTDADKDKDKKVKVFPSFVADDIKEIKIEHLSTTVTALKTPIVIDKDAKDAWVITAPRQFKSDEATVRNILTNVGDLTADTIIENPTNLADFGLNSPTARVTYSSKAKTAFVLLVGDKNVTGSNIYVKSPSGKDVYMVQAFVIDNMTKPVNEYRDKTFFKTDGVLAQKVRVVRNGKAIVFEKTKSGAWDMTRPMNVKADDQKVKDLLNAVSNLRIMDYPDDRPSNPAIYGLSAPHASIEVWSSNEKKPDAIYLGREKLKTSQFFAKSGDDPAVYLVSSYFDKTLDIKPGDYRDKSIMKFDMNAAKSITVSHRGKVYIYKKDDKGLWTCPGRAKAQEEGNFIDNALSTLNIEDYASKKAATGLKDPSYIIEVQLNTGEQRTFRFGNQKKTDVYLASDRSKDVFVVPYAALSQLDTYYSEILTPVPIASPAAK